MSSLSGHSQSKFFSYHTSKGVVFRRLAGRLAGVSRVKIMKVRHLFLWWCCNRLERRALFPQLCASCLRLRVTLPKSHPTSVMLAGRLEVLRKVRGRRNLPSIELNTREDISICMCITREGEGERTEKRRGGRESVCGRWGVRRKIWRGYLEGSG